MEEKKSECFSIANMIELPEWSTKVQFNLAIDPNAQIKTIVDVCCYAFDLKTECATGKATITGRAGVKVVYRDMDGIFNSVTDESPFQEVVSNPSITAESKVVLCNVQTSDDTTFDAKYLKINCQITGNARAGFNLGIYCFQDDLQGLILKKSQMNVMSIAQSVESSCLIENEIALKEKANKVLLCRSRMVCEDIVPFDTYFVMQGEMCFDILYEVERDSGLIVCLKTESFTVKCEFESAFCDKSGLLDLCCMVDAGSQNVNTQFGDNGTTITIESRVLCNGFIFKQVQIETTDDVYSTDNEVTLNRTDREVNFMLPSLCFKKEFGGEVDLAEENSSIEEIIGITNKSVQLKTFTIKDGDLHVAGILLATVVYEDENRQISKINSQIPFDFVQKTQLETDVSMIHLSVLPLNVKVKVKRGTVLDFDVEVQVCAHMYYQETKSLLQSVKFGKPIEYGDVAFQIFIAKPNEEMWDLCKRIRISPEKLAQTNKDLTAPFKGGEKIVIYR